jgi:hypothetical protein
MKIISSFYGQLSTKSTFEAAKYAADNMRKSSGEIISVWHNGNKIYEAK